MENGHLRAPPPIEWKNSFIFFLKPPLKQHIKLTKLYDFSYDRKM